MHSGSAHLAVENANSGEDLLAHATWFKDFVPRRGMKSPDVQTLLANFLPRRSGLPPAEDAIVEVEAATDSSVLCHCNWQPKPVRAERMTLLLVHGLEGSSSSQYMRGIAAKAWHAGWNSIRMNMRNCCGTEALSGTLYHSGLCCDVQAVARHFAQREGLQHIALIGYSMGGGLVLNAAGEWGDRAPEWLRAAVGVSPVIDMAPSADALHDLRNRIYERNFLRNMLRRYRYKAQLAPDRYSVADCKRVYSIRTYDEYIVAPNCGFTGAADYYDKASAARVVERIAVPTLILHALDDPFIRLTASTRAKLLANPHIALVETKHGGHCGFLSPRPQKNFDPADDGYWAESTLMRFIEFAQHRRQPQVH